jgi:hypothetical protein
MPRALVHAALALLVLFPLGCMGGSDEGQSTEPATTSETTTTVQTEQAPPTTTAQEAPPAPPIPVEVAMLPPDGPQAATRLSAKPGCTNSREPVATLRWRPADERGTEQRVIVTIFPEFDQGQFETSRPLASDRSSLTWRRVHGQAIHSWRVLTRHGDGWAASKTARFQGVVCPADYAGP